MSFTIRPQSAAEQTGSNLRNFSEQIADEVQNFACQLWSDFPAFISNNKSLPASFVRGYFSAMCPPTDLPPAPPAQPFTGGQCSFAYTLRYQNAVISGGTFQGWSSTFSVSPTNLIGPISKIVLLVNDVADEDLEHWSYNGQGEQPFLTTDTKTYKFRCTTPNGNIDVAVGTARGRKFIGLVPASGAADNCGNPPPLPYPENEPDPENGDFNYTINIDNGVGDSLSFPLVYAPVNFSFPMKFDLGGIDVTLDIGGITFEGGDNNYTDGPGSNLPDGQPHPVGTDKGPKDNGDTIVIPPDKDDGLDSEELPESPSVEESNIEQLKYVKLQLLEIPQTKGVQWGGGNAPNVYIAGWFEFRSGTYNYPRQPVHFEENIYVAPDGADGFAYTLDVGIIGKATVIKVKV